MEIFSLLFLAAYGVLALWGLTVSLRRYTPSGRALQLPRMAKSLGVSVADIGDSDLGWHLTMADHLCAVCKGKQACETWLASHESADKAPAFCPNAGYLNLARS